MAMTWDQRKRCKLAQYQRDLIVFNLSIIALKRIWETMIRELSGICQELINDPNDILNEFSRGILEADELVRKAYAETANAFEMRVLANKMKELAKIRDRAGQLFIISLANHLKVRAGVGDCTREF